MGYRRVIFRPWIPMTILVVAGLVLLWESSLDFDEDPRIIKVNVRTATIERSSIKEKKWFRKMSFLESPEEKEVQDVISRNLGDDAETIPPPDAVGDIALKEFGLKKSNFLQNETTKSSNTTDNQIDTKIAKTKQPRRRTRKLIQSGKLLVFPSSSKKIDKTGYMKSQERLLKIAAELDREILESDLHPYVNVDSIIDKLSSFNQPDHIMKQNFEKYSVNNTLFVTFGSYGHRDLVKNVELTTTKAYQQSKLVVAALDDRMYAWCNNETTSYCIKINCMCPGRDKPVDFGKQGYPDCMPGVIVCKLKVLMTIAKMGFAQFFLDSDAAINDKALSFIPTTDAVDVIGAREYCTGSCSLSWDDMLKIDYVSNENPHNLNSLKLRLTDYSMVNIGMMWLNTSSTVIQSLSESLYVIIRHNLSFVAMDQIIFNRRLAYNRAKVTKLSSRLGGLNTRSRSSFPSIFPDAWGAHGSRLWSKNNFYKKAFLYVNGLWLVRPLPVNFTDQVEMWWKDPKRLRRVFLDSGEIIF